MKNFPFLFLSILLVPNLSPAAFKGNLNFTDQEKIQHLSKLPEFMTTTAACLQETLKFHQNFYHTYGISPFYGDVSKFGKAKLSEQKQMLRKLHLSSKLLEKMEPISCVGITARCLEQGFQKTGQKSIWEKLDDYLTANDVDGSALQDGLQRLGWKIYYWNPDLRTNQLWDKEEERLYPGNPNREWGMHEERWQGVLRKHRYQDNLVDDPTSLVNFGRSVPELVARAPFFIGSAHGGYHIFPGSYGMVVEAHSARELTDAHTVEMAPFNPMSKDGAPHGYFHSGIIVLPPELNP